MTLREIFKEATIPGEKQCGPALEKKDSRNKAHMYRGSNAGCKECQSMPKVIHGRQTYSYCSPSQIHPGPFEEDMTCSASPFLRRPAVPQRQRTGRDRGQGET